MATLSIKALGALSVLAVGLLSSCASTEDPQPTTGQGTIITNPITVQVQVSEAGAPSYALSDATLVSSNYQTGATRLVLSGKLNSGKVLTLNFSKGNSTAAYTTNVLVATLDGASASPATGSTTFTAQNRTVAGTFQATFSAVGVLSGSFTDVTVP